MGAFIINQQTKAQRLPEFGELFEQIMEPGKDPDSHGRGLWLVSEVRAVATWEGAGSRQFLSHSGGPYAAESPLHGV